ncbi:MAG: PIN domain-containing protein [Anaerolineaceae bacterium]|nr:PIN domain-containing protein [Anaerolineaceae bacterium]
MYVLDTSVTSELLSQEPHRKVAEWFIATAPSLMYLPTATIGELQKFVERDRRSNPQVANEKENRISWLVARYPMLTADLPVFVEWGKLMSGIKGRAKDRLAIDGIIAATASVHNMMVATGNEKDFQRFPVPVINPYRHPLPS